jgi:predicted 3-demethylubiquinone-9 3-methyltransferase (glyoxalase superfamily)
MTHVLIVAPAQEKVIHNIPIFDNTDVKAVEGFVKNKEAEYGEVVRILFSLGEVRVMKDQEEIPVPFADLPRGEH